MPSKKLSAVFLSVVVFGGLTQGVTSAHADGYVAASETGNIREDRYTSPDSPSKITGSVSKMPLMGRALRAANPIAGTIIYHAPAPVMISPNIYTLWYGTWTSPCGDTSTTTTPGILNNILSNIGNSAWYGINTQYYQNISGSQQNVTNVVHPNGCATSTATMGTTLDGGTFAVTATAPTGSTILNVTNSANSAKIYPGETVSGTGIRNRTLVTAVNGLQISISSSTSSAITGGTINFTNPSTDMVVAKAILGGAFGGAVDTNGLYFLFTSSDISVSGFNAAGGFCGYHGYSSALPTAFKYAFIGDPSANIGAGCAPQTTSPHNNAGADAMANVSAHELVEAVSDPMLTAWFDSRGNENGDKCNFVFGTTTSESNSSLSNVTIGGTRYLIQENWSPISSGCFLATPPPPTPVNVTVALSNVKLMVGQSVPAFTPVTASAGTAPYTFTLTPAVQGLRINPSTGQITSQGALSATSGPVTETVSVTDSLGSQQRATFTLQISPALTISTSYAANASALQISRNTPNISQTVVPASGSLYTPYTYSLSQGTLPNGLTIDPNSGFLKGTAPNSISTGSYTVRVTDSAGFTMTRAFFLKII
jgi:hypothetical protein